MITRELFVHVAGIVIVVALAGFACGFLCYWLSCGAREEEEESNHFAAGPVLPPMREKEMQQALAVAENHPVWRAFVQAVSQQRAAAVDEMKAPDCDEELRTYYAGAVANADLLTQFLHEQHARALANVADED